MQTQIAVNRTMIDVVLPDRRLLHNAAVVVGGTLLIALSARISIPIGPVPFTMQTFAVLLVGMLLGSRLGSLTVLAYLAEGLAGLPVFAPSTAPGPAAFLGPTGGYLVGFVAAAAVVGLLAERGWDRGRLTTVLAMVVGNLVIYTFGVGWLSTLIGFQPALANGVYPFLIGDAIKIALAVAVLPTGWALLQRW